jgi:hypothetical protein
VCIAADIYINRGNTAPYTPMCYYNSGIVDFVFSASVEMQLIIEVLAIESLITNLFGARLFASHRIYVEVLRAWLGPFCYSESEKAVALRYN